MSGFVDAGAGSRCGATVYVCPLLGTIVSTSEDSVLTCGGACGYGAGCPLLVTPSGNLRCPPRMRARSTTTRGDVRCLFGSPPARVRVTGAGAGGRGHGRGRVGGTALATRARAGARARGRGGARTVPPLLPPTSWRMTAPVRAEAKMEFPVPNALEVVGGFHAYLLRMSAMQRIQPRTHGASSRPQSGQRIGGRGLIQGGVMLPPARPTPPHRP